MNQRFLHYCLSSPWAMDPAAMSLFATMLVRGYAKHEGVMPFGAETASTRPTARPPSNRQGGIAVLRVHGPIVQRASQLGPCEGGIGAEDVGAALASAMADETISQILCDIDSPGGSVFGISELADQIRTARAQKPIIGVANSMAASAAYWLLAQCSEAYCSPSGQVGSIGVYGAHEDISRALEEAGVTMTLVSAGRFKVESNPFEPLGDEAKANMQADINTYYADFVRAVAQGRGVPENAVRNGMGQGRTLRGDAAKAAGMIDGVLTFPQVVRQMQARGAKGAAKPRASQPGSGYSSASRRRNELALIEATMNLPKSSTPRLNRARNELLMIGG